MIRANRAQVEQQAALLQAADHGGIAAAQRRRQRFRQAHRGAVQFHAGRPAAAHGGLGRHHPGVQPGGSQTRHGPFGPLDDRSQVGGQRAGDWRYRSGEGGLKRGEGQLVHPQRPGQRMPPQRAHQGGPAEQQPGLRTAEELVAARGDQGGAVPQRGGGVRLAGQQRVRDKQPGPDVEHHRGTQAGQLADGHGGGEALDAEVGRVHLEDERGPRPGRLGVVRERRPVSGAHLAQPGAGGGEQVGQPEAVADLDQLASADHDLARLAAGQRGGREDQRGRVVVDHRDRLGGGYGPGQGVERARAAPGADPRGQVELHVAVPCRRHDGVHRRGRQRRPSQVRVHQHPRRVEHRGQRGSPGGQFGHGRVGDLLRGDLLVPGPLLGAAHRRLDQVAAQPAFGLRQAGIGQQQVRARHVAPAIHVANDTPAASEYCALPRVGGGQYRPTRQGSLLTRE